MLKRKFNVGVKSRLQLSYMNEELSGQDELLLTLPRERQLERELLDRELLGTTLTVPPTFPSQIHVLVPKRCKAGVAWRHGGFVTRVDSDGPVAAIGVEPFHWRIASVEGENVVRTDMSRKN